MSAVQSPPCGAGRRRAWLMVVLAMVLTHAGRGQAFRINLLNYSPAAEAMGLLGLNSGIGYEQRIGDHVGVTLEFNFNFVQDNPDDILTPFMYLLIFSGFEYKWRELALQSKYYLKGNRNGSLYFSSGVSFKRISFYYDASGHPVQYSTVTGPQASENRELFIIYPVTMRLGYRAGPEDLYSEYFIGFCYNMGPIEPANAEIKNMIGYKQLNRLNFCAGINIGVGW